MIWFFCSSLILGMGASDISEEQIQEIAKKINELNQPSLLVKTVNFTCDVVIAPKVWLVVGVGCAAWFLHTKIATQKDLCVAAQELREQHKEIDAKSTSFKEVIINLQDGVSHQNRRLQGLNTAFISLDKKAVDVMKEMQEGADMLLQSFKEVYEYQSKKSLSLNKKLFLHDFTMKKCEESACALRSGVGVLLQQTKDLEEECRKKIFSVQEVIFDELKACREKINENQQNIDLLHSKVDQLQSGQENNHQEMMTALCNISNDKDVMIKQLEELVNASRKKNGGESSARFTSFAQNEERKSLAYKG